MGSLETLPPDQRAVIDLVLRRGRGYDDIARLLAIDRAAVRARALAAFEAIGPETGISPESRALITDYLLGQLPARVAEETRERLANSPYDRAWARVLASELGQVASQPLPEIPDGSRAPASAPSVTAPSATEPARGAADGQEPATAPGARRRDGSTSRRDRGARRTPRLSDRPSSILGGAILLIIGAVVVVAVVVALFVLLSSGSGKSGTTAASQSGAASSSAGNSTSTTTPKAQVVGQSNLNPPSGSGPAKGIGIVVKEGNAYGIVIEAAHMTPNNKNAYAAWLYNSSTDAYRLGFVSPPVGKNGTLQVGSTLPTNAGHYKQLLLTLETQSNPKSPGTIVLQGPFTGVPATG